MIAVALEWQERYGVAPQITTPLSEYDAAMLVGMPEQKYSEFMQDITAVNRGSDFIYKKFDIRLKAIDLVASLAAK